LSSTHGIPQGFACNNNDPTYFNTHVSLKCMCVNACSIMNKIDALISVENPDIFGILLRAGHMKVHWMLNCLLMAILSFAVTDP